VDCEEARERIEDLHDGELEGGEAAAVSAHLAACQKCAGMMRQLDCESQFFRSYAAALDRQVEAVASRWPQVRSAISEPQSSVSRGRWWQWLRSATPSAGLGKQLVWAALLVVISVGVTLVVVRQERLRPPGGGESAQQVTGNTGGTGTVAEAMRSIRHAEQEYVDAIQILTGILDRQKPSLSNDLVVQVERNLRQIDESIAATRKAYYEHPADPELAHYMLTAYSRKVELLQELASLGSLQPKT
jgi:Putative zinc-finger